MKITAVLYVDQIEPGLPFWVDKLGMTKIVDVPEGDRLGFVILNKGQAELMIQTRESLAKDVPALLDMAKSSPGLFIEVDDFAATLQAVEGLEVLLPVRETFYGMREIVVREPGGNAVCFAAKI